MTYEEKSAIVIAQLRADRDALLKVIDDIQAEINTPDRGTCDYFIVNKIEEIINKYKEGNDNRIYADSDNQPPCRVCDDIPDFYRKWAANEQN